MKLFPVQLAAKDKANYRERFGYFLDMGLGKSSLVLQEFFELRAAGRCDVMMVICPYSLISTWKDENIKHQFNYSVVVTPDKKAKIEPPSLVLYNYESLIAAAGRLIPELLKQFRVYGVFDESVQIKGFKSRRWKTVRDWHHDLAFVRLLSGRPMVQNPLDLWTQLRLLKGDVSVSPYSFRGTYCKMGGYMTKEVIGAKNEDRLKEVVAKVSFTASKKDWTDLPEKLYTTRSYEMTKAQQKLYDIMFKEMVLELDTGVVSVQMAVHKFVKLQQISSGFVIDDDDRAQPLMPFDLVPKVKLLKEVLEEVSGKTIVFAYYRASVAALGTLLICPIVMGGMTEDEIRLAKLQFNGGRAPVIVMQMASGKYGHTMLGSDDDPCHTTVYFENSYSLDDRVQSEDRNHRHGQKNPVLYADLIGTSVERRMVKALQYKDDLSRTILGMAKGEW